MAKAITVRELHARMAKYIESGNGDAVVFTAVRDDEIAAAMSKTNWTPAEFDLTSADVTGYGQAMLVIGSVAFSYEA